MEYSGRSGCQNTGCWSANPDLGREANLGRQCAGNLSLNGGQAEWQLFSFMKASS